MTQMVIFTSMTPKEAGLAMAAGAILAMVPK